MNGKAIDRRFPCFTTSNPPSLAERHRPLRFSDVVGQETAVAYLESQAREGTGRSVLLFGPSGCGKTVLAEIYATALLCTSKVGGEPCLAPDCPDCAECSRRSHPNWRGIRDATIEEVAFARRINADVDTESFGGGKLVISIDQAHNLSKRAFDVLHDRMERTPANVTFILCTTEIDGVLERARSLFRLLEIGPVGMPSRVELLRKICGKERFIYEDAALDLFARRSGGFLRQMVRDLEALAEQGPITLDQVRTFYESDGARQIARYVEILLDRGGLGRQMAALDAWSAPPERKISGIEGYFAELFGAEVLRIGRRGVILDLAGVEDQDPIVRNLVERGERLRMPPRQFCHEVLKFWSPIGSASDALLLRKVSEFDELLNGPAGLRSPEAPTLLVPPRRKLQSPAARNLSLKTKGSARRSDATPAAGVGYLSLKQVRELWEAASFLVQMFGLFLNTRISIRYAPLRIGDPTKIGPFLTGLMHELRMLVNGRASTEQCPEPFHWLFVHEHSPTAEFRTLIAATVPSEAGNIGRWLRDDYLPHHLGFACPPGAVSIWRREIRNGEHFAHHLQLLRLLCRGLDPTYTIPLQSNDGVTTRIALIERIGVPRRLRDQIGRRFGAQRYSSSRLIAPEARRMAASSDLPPLSAFEEGAWLYLDTGWEISEHEYRQMLKAKRAGAEAELDREWPAQADELALKRRDAEFERFRETWLKAADARERMRPGMSGAALGDFHNSEHTKR